jgi:hypothetical protein
VPRPLLVFAKSKQGAPPSSVKVAARLGGSGVGCTIVCYRLK